MNTELMTNIAVWGTVVATLGAIVSVVLAYHETKATWFTDKIAWRYVCIVNGSFSYFFNIRLAKKFPEIKHLVNRNCFWRIVKVPYWTVLFVVFAPFYVPYIIMSWITDHVSVPDPNDHAVKALQEMDKIVPTWKIRKGMGLPYETLFEDMDSKDE